MTGGAGIISSSASVCACAMQVGALTDITWCMHKLHLRDLLKPVYPRGKQAHAKKLIYSNQLWSSAFFSKWCPAGTTGGPLERPAGPRIPSVHLGMLFVCKVPFCFFHDATMGRLTEISQVSSFEFAQESCNRQSDD